MLSVIRKKLMQKYKINYINIVSVVFASITIFSLAFTYVYLFDMSTIGFFGHFIVVINFLLIILGIFIFFAYFKKNKSLKEKYIDRDRVFSGAFINNPISSIFTESGKVLVANKSYMNFYIII